MSYRPPALIPDVPSSTISRLLQSRFSDAADNVLKAVVAHFVCAGFQSMMMTYYALRRGSLTESYRLWVVSCVLVSAILTVACFVTYTVVIASAFIVRALLFYGLILIALVGMAMGLAGVVLYDRNVKEPPSKAALDADQTLGYSEDYKVPSSSSTSSAAAAATSSSSVDKKTKADNEKTK